MVFMNLILSDPSYFNATESCFVDIPIMEA